LLRRWTLAQVSFLAVVTMCAATIAVVSIGFTKQIGENRRAIRHLCALQSITMVVYNSAIRSYTSLPHKTSDQLRLLRAIREGVREIRTDRSCPR